ncbi:MAG: GNAT family N-acetyltransferase [Minisyncoccia bacterium]|jgi:GNAT superfamily N-acetyltransferase
MEIIIDKPKLGDLGEIRKILAQWTDNPEVEKYVKRIQDEITRKIEFNTHYWVARYSGMPVGIVGLCDPLPQVLPFAKTSRPGKFKILYVDGAYRGKGIGKKLVDFLENEARKEGYAEVLARSAERYRDTSYGFYEKMGYKNVGTVYAGEDRSKPMRVFRKEL